MQRMPIPLLDPTRNPAPHQGGIATAVIERALLDATAAHDRYNVRADAKAFLSGSEMFDHWCKVAGLDPALLRVRAERASGGATVAKVRSHRSRTQSAPGA